MLHACSHEEKNFVVGRNCTRWNKWCNFFHHGTGGYDLGEIFDTIDANFRCVTYIWKKLLSTFIFRFWCAWIRLWQVDDLAIFTFFARCHELANYTLEYNFIFLWLYSFIFYQSKMDYTTTFSIYWQWLEYVW